MEDDGEQMGSGQVANKGSGHQQPTRMVHKQRQRAPMSERKIKQMQPAQVSFREPMPTSPRKQRNLRPQTAPEGMSHPYAQSFVLTKKEVQPIGGEFIQTMPNKYKKTSDQPAPMKVKTTTTKPIDPDLSTMWRSFRPRTQEGQEESDAYRSFVMQQEAMGRRVPMYDRKPFTYSQFGSSFRPQSVPLGKTRIRFTTGGSKLIDAHPFAQKVRQPIRVCICLFCISLLPHVCF